MTTNNHSIRPAVWVGVALIVASLAFGAKAFVANLTPYVSFAQAREAKGGVQVMGKLDKASIATGQGKTLDFVIVDDAGDRMHVTFDKVRPANFEQATQVTAVGQYDGNVFQAKSLLVKCPTKYQGTETKEYAADAQDAAAPSARTETLRGVEAMLSGKGAPNESKK